MVQARSDIGGLDISPDGTQIAFGASQTGSSVTDYSTFVVPAPLGGVPRKLVRSRPRSAFLARRQADRVRESREEEAETPSSSATRTGRNPEGDLPDAHPRPRTGVVLRRPVHLFPEIDCDDSPGSLRRSGGWRRRAGRRSASSPPRGSRSTRLPCRTGEACSFPPTRTRPRLGLWWLPPSESQAGPHHDRGGRVRASPDIAPTGASSPPRLSIRSVPFSSSPPTAVAAADAAEQRVLSETPIRRLSPAGDRLVWSSARSGNRNLWIGKADGSGGRPLTTGNALDETPAFSPDGKQIAFVSDRSGTRGIWVVDAQGGTPRELHRAEVVDPLSWSPDGKEILFCAPAGDGEGLYQLSVAEGRVTALPTPTGARAPAWNPRQPLIAYLIQEPASAEPKPRRNRMAFVDPSGKPQLEEAARAQHLQRTARLVSGRPPAPGRRAIHDPSAWRFWSWMSLLDGPSSDRRETCRSAAESSVPPGPPTVPRS